MDKAESLHRYTNLAATIHLLRSRRITLLNPETWDDKNDSYYMAEYKRFRGAATVLALCFAESRETYHHWKVFSHGSDGVRIEFDKDKLLSAFVGDPHITMRHVHYKMIKELRNRSLLTFEDIPFLKREPYKDEREFRVVYVDCADKLAYKDYKIEISWIRRITLSPWLSKGLADSVRGTLRSINGCSRLSIVKSTLIENESWKSVAKLLHR